MSCLSVIIERIGAMAASFRRIGGSKTSVRRVGGSRATIRRVGAASASVQRVGSLSVRFGLVCGTNLDQRPGILWASDGRLITIEGGFLIPNGR